MGLKLNKNPFLSEAQNIKHRNTKSFSRPKRMWDKTMKFYKGIPQREDFSFYFFPFKLNERTT